MTEQASPAPYSMLAEITHRCPLHCVYCSNPAALIQPHDEISTADWQRALEQARALGVVQMHFSGGEPLVRADLEVLVRRARELEFYVNLITSGAGLGAERAHSLADAGLDNLQLSLQAADRALNARIGDRDSLEEKRRAAELTREAGLALSMNVVLHRMNLDELEAIIDLCASWGAERLELANAQYYGWALANRAPLLPTRSQLERAEAVARRKKQQYRGKMEIIWVLPDYYEPFPKPCMGGWGRIHLTVSPDGSVLPCPAASTIRTLQFENIRDRALDWIWYESPSFKRFRGFDWMPEPCRSCDRRTADFGGCRCQAFALTGDAASTDPVCQWAPHHQLVEAAVAHANDSGGNGKGEDDSTRLIYRQLARTS